MPHELKRTLPSLLAAPSFGFALAALCAATFALSVFLVLSLGAPAPLRVAIIALSGGALLLALVSAWATWLQRAPRLEQLITICAWTRRVLWQGRWISMEDYLAQRFNLRCTHGICEEAADKLREATEKVKLTSEFPRS